MGHSGLKFFWLKLKVYLGFSIPLAAPSMYFMHNVENEWAAVGLSWLGTMVALHLLVMDDTKERFIDLKHLVMRRRHFDAMSNEKEAP